MILYFGSSSFFYYRSIKAIVSHKYGSAFLPTQIEKHGFELIRNELAANLSYDLKFRYDKGQLFEIENALDHCYALDTNVDPNIYRLKDLNEIIVLHFKDDEKSFKSIDNKYMKELWFELEQKLINLFQRASLDCLKAKKISDEFADTFFCSGTF